MEETKEKPKKKPNYEQKHEYRVADYQRPYKDYGGKDDLINKLALQGWELVCTSVIPMGISDDFRTINWFCLECGNLTVQKQGDPKPTKCTKCGNVDLYMSINKKVWSIEHLYFRREMKGE